MLKNFIGNLNNAYNKGRTKKKPWRLRNSLGTYKPFKMPKKKKKSSLFFAFFKETSFRKQKNPTRLNLNMKKNLIFHYYLKNFLYPQYKTTAWKRFIQQKLTGTTKNTIANFLWLLNSRIDHLLLKLHFRYNLNSIIRIIRGGWILVNGKAVTKPGYNVAIGSLISFSYSAYIFSKATQAQYKGNTALAYKGVDKPIVSKTIFKRLGWLLAERKQTIRLLHKKRKHYIHLKRYQAVHSFMVRLKAKQKKTILVFNKEQNLFKPMYIGTKWSKFFGTSLENLPKKEKKSSSYFKILKKKNKWKYKRTLKNYPPKTSKAFHLKVSKAYFICRQLQKTPLIVKNFRTNLKTINNISLSNFIEFNPKIYTYLIFRNIYTKLKNKKITHLNIKASILKKIYDNRYFL